MITRLNDRPNKYINGVLYVYNLKNIPNDYASEKEWKRRGYKVRDREWRKGYLITWCVQNYLEFDLYHFSQVEPIRGKKAEERRASYEQKPY